MTVSQHRRISRPRTGRWPALALAALGLWHGASALAAAAGLGQLRLQSQLGQPLRAEVDIAGLAPDDPSAIQVALAAPEAYARAGLAYPAALAGATWQLKKQPDGSYVAQLRSNAPVSEPFVDLLVEMRWPGGQAARTYTLLLDTAAVPAEARPATEPMIVRAEGTGGDPHAPVAVEPTPAGVPHGNGRAYTVRRGDNLYGIAQTLMPAAAAADSVSLDQLVVALFRANPRAFIAGNMNRLKAGAVLKLPGDTEAAAIAPGEARRELVAHTQAFDAYRNRLAAAAAAAVPTRGNGQQQAGRITARVDEAAGPAAGPRDELTLSKPEGDATKRQGGEPQGDAEAGVARERQLREAEARLAQLRKNVDDIERLLELKSAEMARLGERAGQGGNRAQDGVDGAALAGAAPGADAAAMDGNRPAAPVAPADWLSGPYVLPLGGAMLALLAGYGLYRRQRGRQAFAGPAGDVPEGPLVFGDLTLPLEAFPNAADDAAKADRHTPVADGGMAGATSPAWPPRKAAAAGGSDAGADPDLDAGDDEDDPDAASRRPPAASAPPPAFDFGGLSLDLDADNGKPARGTVPDAGADATAGAGTGPEVPRAPRDPGQGSERA